MKLPHGKRTTIWVAAIISCCGAIAGAAGALGASGNASRSLTPASSQAVPESVPSDILSAWPFLSRQLTTSEEQQLPAVGEVVARLSELRLRAGGTDSLNVNLARRYYDVEGRTAFLVPGGSGEVCSVVLDDNRPAGGSCTLVKTAQTKGLVKWVVVGPENYEVSGLLPLGSSSVSVADAGGHVSSVPLDSAGGFDFVGHSVPTRVAYTVAGGHEEVIEEPFGSGFPGH